MSGCAPWQESWTPPESCIVTSTLPAVESAPPARFCGRPAGALFVAVNHEALQPATEVP
jgi:hypothetical protein